MIIDYTPLNTPKTALTDCLNGTMITYDGNEFSLQNDKGNYRLSDCSLKKNFVPIGTASYGDIIYIASYNPLTDEAELGTYPSPNTNIASNDNSNEFDASSILTQAYKGEERWDYNTLIKAYQRLNVFINNNNTLKINVSDKYRLTDIPQSIHTFERLRFYIIDEAGEMNDITSYIEEDKDKFDEYVDVRWPYIGNLAFRWELPSIDKFSGEIRSLLLPLKLTDAEKFSGKGQLSINLQASSDNDFLREVIESKALGVRYIIVDEEGKCPMEGLTDIVVPLNDDYSSYDTSRWKVQMFDTDHVIKYSDEEFYIAGYEPIEFINVNKDALLSKTFNLIAIPFIITGPDPRELSYTNMGYTASFNVNEFVNANTTVADTYFTYAYNEGQFAITCDFNKPLLTEGSDVLEVRLYDLKKQLIAKKSIPQSAKLITTTFTVPEDFYILVFIDPENSIILKEYFVVASPCMNDFTVQHFNEISLDEWLMKAMGVKNETISASTTTSFMDIKVDEDAFKDTDINRYFFKEDNEAFVARERKPDELKIYIRPSSATCNTESTQSCTAPYLANYIKEYSRNDGTGVRIGLGDTPTDVVFKATDYPWFDFTCSLPIVQEDTASLHYINPEERINLMKDNWPLWPGRSEDNYCNYIVDHTDRGEARQLTTTLRGSNNIFGSSWLKMNGASTAFLRDLGTPGADLGVLCNKNGGKPIVTNLRLDTYGGTDHALYFNGEKIKSEGRLYPSIVFVDNNDHPVIISADYLKHQWASEYAKHFYLCDKDYDTAYSITLNTDELIIDKHNRVDIKKRLSLWCEKFIVNGFDLFNADSRARFIESLKIAGSDIDFDMLDTSSLDWNSSLLLPVQLTEIQTTASIDEAEFTPVVDALLTLIEERNTKALLEKEQLSAYPYIAMSSTRSVWVDKDSPAARLLLSKQSNGDYSLDYGGEMTNNLVKVDADKASNITQFNVANSLTIGGKKITLEDFM